MLHAMWPREVASVTLGDVWLTGTQCNFFCLNRTRRLSTWILAILGLRSNCIMGLFWQTNFDPLFCATSWKPIENFKPSHSAIRHNTDPVSGGISKWQSLFCSSFLKPFFILFRVCFFFFGFCFCFIFHFIAVRSNHVRLIKALSILFQLNAAGNSAIESKLSW